MARNVLKSILNAVNGSELPIEQVFLNSLCRSIETTQACHKPSMTYKPSSMQCPRNMLYQVTGADAGEEKDTNELIGICESGEDRHIRLQNAIKNMPDWEFCSVSEYVNSRHLQDLEVVLEEQNETLIFNKKLNMRFKCDGILRYKGQYFILEIKTITSREFWKLDRVLDKHIPQAVAYSNNFGIDTIIFLYENRDNCSKKAFRIDITEEMRQKQLELIAQCEEAKAEGKLIAIPQDLDKTVICKYCKYKILCRKEEANTENEEYGGE